MLPNWETFKNYLINESEFGTKESNLNANKSRFNKLANYFSGKEFSRENLWAFVGKMKEAGLSPATQNKHISMAKQIDKYLSWRDKTPLILAGYKYKKEGGLKRHDIFTVEEMFSIRDFDYPYKKYKNELNARAKAMFGLLIDTGCRADEVCELKWKNIVAGDTPNITFEETKNGASRTNIVTQGTYEAIQQLPRKGVRVFSSGRGDRINTHQILEDLHKRADVIGIKKRVWTHLFRITFITLLINAGVDWFYVSVIVGHKDPKTTKRYYQQSLEPQKRAISRHPVFKKHLTHQQNIELAKEFFNNSINTDSSRLIVEDSGGSLVIRIEKKE